MKIDWNSLPPAAGLRTGTVRKAVCGNLISAVFIENAGDTVFDGRLHWHENEQLMVILSGLCTIVVDGKEIEATPGDLVFVPSGGAARCRGLRPGGVQLLRDFRARATRSVARVGRKAGDAF